MKKVFLQLAATLLLAGMFASCSKEQSELTLKTVKGQATVTGKVMYNAGSVRVNGAIISDYMVPAAGETVMVKVQTEEYAYGSQGSQTFTGEVDEKGIYTIQVPVGINPVTATVTVLPFRADKSVAGLNSTLVVLENALYNEVTDQTLSLDDQMIEVADLNVYSSDEPGVVYDQAVTLKGEIEVQAWKRNVDTDEWEAGTTGFATAIEVEVELLDPADPTYSSTLKYQGTANAEGAYELTMTLPNICWDKDVNVSVKTVAKVGTFSHRYYLIDDAAWKLQEVQVLYKSQERSMSLAERNQLLPMAMPKMTVTTEPVDKTSVYGIGNPIDIEKNIATNDPFGWGF